ncbi:NAD-dependent epimerase/dehydratase family protein [Gilvibacter sediminis]|uniref:polysaccharide biosynthesis C-terminal domain-containing protein n=1 Tax=Gilvibacter sediminis TaxID=379071 RepID=UPI002350E2CD|nr:NAD-dependent epimerase/dehydratase family protein [Gilvibacter sediminis]MDC7999133.1 NAD-dependent epimerase/dehydratase family protein [Gilvibacter sediminis]
MIRVGITGQAGFIGQHLYNFLGTKAEQVSRSDFQRDMFDNPEALTDWVASCDVIVHIAAMNRHEDPQVIYDTNVGLVQKLIDACKSAAVTPKIIFSSSTQEEQDNLYGQSKRDGRQLLETWAQEEGGSVTSLLIPNVFGPFGKPFYNSFIATFCHLLNTGGAPEVHQDAEVSLIYVNALVAHFYAAIISEESGVVFKAIEAPYKAKVTEVLQKLEHFKTSYVEQGQVPDISQAFDIDLFNTFTSYIPKDYFPRKFVKHTDNRGAFVEIMRAGTSGQSSYSTTVPGITRGNHYHTRKVERFAVISGKASIKLRKVNTDKVYEYILDGSEPAYVDMPIWYTHNITNIGDEELITLFWINEPYDPADPDTYFESVD